MCNSNHQRHSLSERILLQIHSLASTSVQRRWSPLWHTDQGSSSHKCMSTLLNCWEGVRKGGGGGGDLHYSLDIMSFFKDLTQKLVNSFFTNQNKDISKHRQIFFCKSRKNTSPLQTHCQIFFFANHEQRHVQYKHFVNSFFLQITNKDKSITNTLSNLFWQITKEDISITKTLSNLFLAIHEQRHVQYKHFVKSLFFANHELKDMSITNLKTDQECKTLGMILSTIRKVERLWSWCVSYLRKQRDSTFHQIWEQQEEEEEEEEECTKKQYQQGRWHDTLLHADLQWQHSRNPLQLLLTLADEYLLLHKVQLVVVVVELPWLVQEKCLLKSVLLLLFCRPSQELVAQAEEEEEALLMTVEKQSSVSAAHNTTTHTYLLPTYLSKILKLFAVLFCCSLLFYSVLFFFTKQNRNRIFFFLISSRNTPRPRFMIFNKERRRN